MPQQLEPAQQPSSLNSPQDLPRIVQAKTQLLLLPPPSHHSQINYRSALFPDAKDRFLHLSEDPFSDYFGSSTNFIAVIFLHLLFWNFVGEVAVEAKKDYKVRSLPETPFRLLNPDAFFEYKAKTELIFVFVVYNEEHAKVLQ
jgi:hypothetical protein